MIRIASAIDLLETFRASERDEVQIPTEFTFPMALKDYTAWLEPSGHRVYLVFQDPQAGRPIGIVFQRTRGSSETPAALCQWCHSVRSGDGVSLLTARVDGQRRVGVHLCSSLECRDNIFSTPGIHDMLETIPRRERLENVLRRMSSFAHRNLI